jgi:hypothetical protein
MRLTFFCCYFFETPHIIFLTADDADFADLTLIFFNFNSFL